MVVDCSVVLLDATQTVKEATGFARQQAYVHFVVIRRDEAATTFWYTYRTVEFLRIAEEHPPDRELWEALDLRESSSTKVHHEGTEDVETYRPGAVVVNDRGRVVGVLEIEYLAPAPPDGGPHGPIEAEVPTSRREAPADREAVPGTSRDLVFLDLGETGENIRPTADLPVLPVLPTGEDFGLAGPSGILHGRSPRRRSARASSGRKKKSGRPSPGKKKRGGPMVPPVPAPEPKRAPFAAWPCFDTPQRVAPGQEFDLTIGLQPQRQDGVSGGPVTLVDAPPTFELLVRIVAVGFRAPEGWTRTLHVERDTPFGASETVRLIAEHYPTGESERRTIEAQFYFESNLCGQAQRSIEVTAETAPDATVSTATTPPSVTTPLRVRSGLAKPDLTVTVRLTPGHGNRDRFTWTFESPHAIAVPEGATITTLEQHCGTFIDRLLDSLVTHAGGPQADNEMKGVGRDIADNIPPSFWSALRDVASVVAREDRVPTVQFVSDETRLPWELAWMRHPLDPTRPAHLAAQVEFGRWIVGWPEASLPPEDELPWHQMVVVVGTYPPSSGLELPDAVEEAQTLAKRTHQPPIALDGEQLDPLLHAESPTGGAQIVHFACHGTAQSGSIQTSSLIMQNGHRFTPQTLRGSEIGEKWKPFLFMNACEVGRAGVGLGQTAGFVGAALREGCRAFVGPLWKVDSKVARDVAVHFYEEALDGGRPVAGVLRDLRSRYAYGGANAPPTPDTYLAYAYYGHPALRFVHET